MRKRFGLRPRVAGLIMFATLVATACVVLWPATAGANSPVTGAAFTSVNEAVDGTGHCANGNPNTNCNIYDGKKLVWLNGGPSTAYVGDGSYFFAVLDPGGQADPNDGAAKNLSDDFDAYTNRTFSVSGGTVSYSGSHDFDSNKIRLMPYADTLNPGGVYTNTYTWQISKDADKTLVKQVGGNATFNYTVRASHDGGNISGVNVSGTISVFNPNVDTNND